VAPSWPWHSTPKGLQRGQARESGGAARRAGGRAEHHLVPKPQKASDMADHGVGAGIQRWGWPGFVQHQHGFLFGRYASGHGGAWCCRLQLDLLARGLQRIAEHRHFIGRAEAFHRCLDQGLQAAGFQQVMGDPGVQHGGRTRQILRGTGRPHADLMPLQGRQRGG
jgi:hypothetical protein